MTGKWLSRSVLVTQTGTFLKFLHEYLKMNIFSAPSPWNMSWGFLMTAKPVPAFFPNRQDHFPQNFGSIKSLSPPFENVLLSPCFYTLLLLSSSLALLQGNSNQISKKPVQNSFLCLVHPLLSPPWFSILHLEQNSPLATNSNMPQSFHF